MRLFFVHFLLTIILCNSCINKSETLEFDEEYLITSKIFLGDSLIENRNSEYIATIKIVGDNYRWTKKYFNRNLFLDEIEYSEELFIDCNINTQSEVTVMNNWDALHEAIELYINYLIKNSEAEGKSIDDKFISIATDSLLIQNKTTKDIQIFNQAYQVYLNEDTVYTNAFSKQFTDSSIIYKIVLAVDLNETQEYVNNINQIIDDSIFAKKFSFSELEISQNLKNLSIEKIKHTTTIKSEQFEEIRMIIEMASFNN